MKAKEEAERKAEREKTLRIEEEKQKKSLEELANVYAT